MDLQRLIEDPGQTESLTRDDARALALALAPLVKALDLRALSIEPAPPPKPEPATTALLTPQEAAQMLGVPVRRVYRAAWLRPARRALGGRTLRFDRRTLERIVAAARPER